DALVNAVSSITRVIRVPLTVDVEGGYSDDPAAVAATVLRVVRAGAAGINLEDGAGDPARLAAKIQAIREACVAHDLDVFINARTDVYLRSLVAENARIDETLALAALERLGVRRISTGSALAESMYGQLAAQVDTFLHADTTPLPDPQAMGYGAINGLFG
ncbi:MAG: isocitrate lyase/phosphoenolpyruvate mutase family protein, partial [Xanthomonas sp.]|nr:isocitrate lyase/phosphoenolpyruvate mutase family protein [Xanthomonas sp.]